MPAPDPPSLPTSATSILWPPTRCARSSWTAVLRSGVPLGHPSYGTAILSDAERIYYNTVRRVGAWHHDGTPAWGRELGADFQPGAAEMLHDASRLYVTGRSELVAIDKASGQIAYRVDLPPGPNAEPATSHVPPFRLFYPGDISDDGLLYLPSQHFTSRGNPVDWSVRGETGTLFCIEAATGRVRWQYEAPTYMGYEPAIQDSINHTGSFDGAHVSGNRVFVYGGAYLIALDRYTGEELWRFNAGAQDDGFGFSKTLSADEHHVYAGSALGYVRAFDTVTGKLVWDHRVYTSFSGWTPLVYGERLFLVHSFGNGLFVYNRRTGDVLLNGADPPDQDELAAQDIQSYYWTAPAIARETVVMGGLAGVYALRVGPPD